MARPRRDPSEIGTRDKIIVTAIDLFDRHGFDQVTVGDIADAIGITQRTIFRHFAAKADIVLEPVRFSYFLPVSHRAQGQSTYEVLSAALADLARAMEERRGMVVRHARIVMNSIALTAMAHRLGDEAMRMLRADLAALLGEPEDATQMFVAAAIVYAIVFAARHEWLDTEETPVLGVMEKSLVSAKAFIASL